VIAPALPAGAAGWAALLSTPLNLLLLGLALLNAVALLRPRSLLSRAVGAALLAPLLVLLALPLPGTALGPLLRLAIPLLVVLLLAALLRTSTSKHAVPPGLGSASPSTLPLQQQTYVLTALAASLAIGLLLALRPYPFEYPGDSTDYLQGFIQAQLEPPPARSCLVEGLRQPTYQRFCTLWGVVLQAGHLDRAVLLGGVPQRLTIGLEVTVLGLSSFRLLQAAGVGAAAASLNWLLVAFGLGNQAIAFLVNNALQGSILAAAIFLEAVMVLLRLLARPGPPPRQAAAVVAALMVFTLLGMKLHGAFALCTLVLLVPLLTLVGAARLGGHTRRAGHGFEVLSRPTAGWLLVASLGVLALVLSLKTGWLLNKQARFIVPWSFLGWLGLPPHALPGSFLMRSPGSRPETLAVAAILVGIVLLARSWRPGSRRAAQALQGGTPGSGPPAEGWPRGHATDQPEAQLYGFVASLYGLAVLVAFLLPPFSHLFINLPYEVISNYRLMWGCILFSPLPALLQRACEGGRSSSGSGPAARLGALMPKALAALLTALVLVPVPSGSARYPQLFWSKSRHILQGPSGRVDLAAVAAALVPAVAEAPRAADGGPPVALVDELIASALAPYASLVRPTHPIRIYSRADLVDPRQWDTQAPLREAPTEADRLRRLQDLESRPSLVIQQQPFDAAAAYSPYGEIGVYEKDIVSVLSATSVNALSPTLLRAAGFEPWKRLDQRGRELASAEPQRATFAIWRRVAPP
jgi:hypothetical protein